MQVKQGPRRLLAHELVALDRGGHLKGVGRILGPSEIPFKTEDLAKAVQGDGFADLGTGREGNDIFKRFAYVNLQIGREQDAPRADVLGFAVTGYRHRSASQDLDRQPQLESLGSSLLNHAGISTLESNDLAGQ